MKAIAYSIKHYEKDLLINANNMHHDIVMVPERLSFNTVAFARGMDAVIVFTVDDLSMPILRQLKELGIKYIISRSSGTDHVDLDEAKLLNIQVENIPVYSPISVAEHAVTLMLALCRNILAGHSKMLESDFSIDDLVGTTLGNKTIGVIGLGKTGEAIVPILRGFGARVIVSDILDVKSTCASLNVELLTLDEVFDQADILTFHVPLTERTKHMVNAESIRKMKNGVMLINVSRGAIFNAEEVFEALQNGKISKLGMDVYEFEKHIFFVDHSQNPVNDRLLKAFIQHSRVLLTPHQAFLTSEGLFEIAKETIHILDRFQKKERQSQDKHLIDK